MQIPRRRSFRWEAGPVPEHRDRRPYTVSELLPETPKRCGMKRKQASRQEGHDCVSFSREARFVPKSVPAISCQQGTAQPPRFLVDFRGARGNPRLGSNVAKEKVGVRDDVVAPPSASSTIIGLRLTRGQVSLPPSSQSSCFQYLTRRNSSKSSADALSTTLAFHQDLIQYIFARLFVSCNQECRRKVELALITGNDDIIACLSHGAF